jgi:hypothetical protein
LGFVDGVLVGNGSAAVVANGSPTATVVPSQPVLLSMFRREIMLFLVAVEMLG